MEFPPGSAMTLGYPTNQTRSIPSSTIGSNSISNPIDKTEEDKKKQAQLDLLKKSYEDYNQKQTDKYNQQLIDNKLAEDKYKADLEKYNQEKLDYDTQLVEYNKKLDEYNSQKAAYDQAVEQLNKEQEADHVAFKYYSTGRNVAGETPLVRKYYDYYVNRDDVKRASDLLNAQTTVSSYEQAYNSLDKDVKVYFKNTEQLRKDLAFNIPKLPEGTQGVSTPEGIIYQEIPTTPTVITKVIPPTVVRPNLNNALSPSNNLFNILQPPQNVLNKDLNIPNQVSYFSLPSNINLGNNSQGTISNIQPVVPVENNLNYGPKPILEVTKAPTMGEIYKYDVKDSGYVQGTLNFFGQRLSGGYDYAQQKGLTSSYQQEPIRNLLGSLPETAYFTSIAPELFLAKGTEEVINPSINKNTEPILKSYGGFIDIGLGLIGVREQSKLLRERSLLNQANKIVESKPVFDINTNELTITSTTKTQPTEFDRNILGIKPQEFSSEVKGKVSFDQAQKFIGEQTNKVTTIEPLKNKIDITFNKVEATTGNFGSNPRIINPKTGSVLPIEGETSITKIQTTKTGIGSYEVKTNPATKMNLANDYKINVGESKGLANQPTMTDTYLGVNKNNEFISAKAEKVGLDKSNRLVIDIGDQNFISGKVSSYGKTKIIETVPEVKVTGNAPSDYNLIDFKASPNQVKGNLEISEIKPTETIGKSFNEEIPRSQIEVKPKFETISHIQSKTESSLINSMEEIKPSSKFYGTGQYERYSFSESLQPKTNLVISKSNIPSSSFQDITGSGIQSLGITGNTLSLGVQSTNFDSESIKPVQTNFNLQKPDEISRQRAKENLSNPIKEGLIQVPKLETPQKTKQDLIQTPVETTTQIIKTPSDTTLKNPPINIVLPKSKGILGEKKKLNIKKLVKGYNVLRRSKGKIEVIGKNLPLNKATKLGVDISKGSLSQTFALKESGYTQDQDISYRLPTQLFTAPKSKRTNITNLTFVERRGKTLTERKEVSLLQKSKKLFK